MARRRDNEEPDLKLAKKLIFRGRGLTLERFDRADTLAGRTPDFRVLLGNTLKAFCEVKSPRDDWLDEQIEAAPPGQIAGGPRSDPVINRIARHVKKAASQFDAVNGDHAVPNILVFINHDVASGLSDLHETLTGMRYAESGERFSMMRHISDGRIGEARKKIDLYIWIDRRTSCVQYLFNDIRLHHVQMLCDLLGLDPNEIQPD